MPANWPTGLRAGWRARAWRRCPVWLVSAAGAEHILAIDGCPLNCTRHTLELAGFKPSSHLELHRLGLRKGACPVTEENIAAGVAAAQAMLATPIPDETEMADAGLPAGYAN